MKAKVSATIRVTTRVILALALLALMMAAVLPAGAAPSRPASFSLDFIATDIVDVLKALSLQSGVNIAVSGQAQGQVTLRLTDVTLEQALNIVTRLNGLDYTMVDNVYVVGLPAEVKALKGESLESVVIPLQYISVDYARAAVGQVAPEATLTVQPGTNNLFVVGSRNDLPRVQAVIAQIDLPAPPEQPATDTLTLQHITADQAIAALRVGAPDVTAEAGPNANLVIVRGLSDDRAAAAALVQQLDIVPPTGVAEMEIYRIKYGRADQLMATLVMLVPDLSVSPGPRTHTPTIEDPGSTASAAILSGPQVTSHVSSVAGTSGATTGMPTEAAEMISPVTTLILIGSRETIDRGLGVLAKVDGAPRQVEISAMITEIRTDVLEKLGIDWSGLSDLGLNIQESTYDPTVDPGEQPAGDLQIGRIVRQAMGLSATISALVTSNDAKILAKPRMTVLEGRQATFHAGETIYYPRRTFVANVGVVDEPTPLPVGVTLIINPRISPDGEVTLTLQPVVSAIAPSVFPGYPTVTERRSLSTVRVKDGETLVIGGLIQDNESVTTSKVPLLGDIPLIGQLFRHRVKQPSHTEVLVFITPRVIPGDE
jgi:type II secretory pathway component GspD/PulD (secretin)